MALATKNSDKIPLIPLAIPPPPPHLGIFRRAARAFQIARTISFWFWTRALIPYIKRLPTVSGHCIPVFVKEIKASIKPSQRARRWETLVHAPFIRDDPARADRDWDWVWEIPILTFAVGAIRRPRLFQLAHVEDNFPLGMIALLENERWPRDHALPAVYVWYLTGAPDTALVSLGRPKPRTAAVLDIAVTIALNGLADGRLWLHAAPEGVTSLMAWYTSLGLEPVAGDLVLPSAKLVPRDNDGRYFQLTPQAARDFSRRLDRYRN